MNYLWDFSQSEMEKYFEWMINIIIIIKTVNYYIGATITGAA